MQAKALQVLTASTLPSQGASRSTHWSALLVSGFLHLGIVSAMALYAPKPPVQDMERGGEALAIDVAMVSDFETAATESGAAAAEMPPAPPEPVPPVETASITLPDLTDVPELVLPPPAPVQPPPQKGMPRPKPVVPRKVVQPRPESEATPTKATPAKVSARRKAVAQAQPEAAPEARGEAGRGRATQTRLASTRGGTGGQARNAGAGEIASYRARVIAHLTRYKNYPEQAQDRGITGANSVTITLTQDGRVVSSSLSGSGHSLLDSATQAALRRAQPFPPMPAGGPGSITISVRMRYDLR